MLIVCEGENTEPSYFDQFRLSSASVQAVGGKKNPVNVVNYARKLAKLKGYDEVWCVFDKDDVPNDDFNGAIRQAESEGFRVAWSNQSFEYWLLLHFEDNHGAPLHRNEHYDRLNTHLTVLGVFYDGKGRKEIDARFFDVLDGVESGKKKARLQLAIDRAGKNHGRCQREELTPADSESCTTVYKLMKRFSKYR